MNNRIFLIHGHDSQALQELSDFISRKGLQPMILKDMPDIGNTIIEKFEVYAHKCNYAIALLTPDDLQADKLDDKFRARQNVIFEMGWFMGKYGRGNIMLLHKGEVELPSDVTGILYLSFNNKISEVSDKIDKELIAWGLLPKSQ